MPSQQRSHTPTAPPPRGGESEQQVDMMDIDVDAVPSTSTSTNPNNTQLKPSTELRRSTRQTSKEPRAPSAPPAPQNETSQQPPQQEGNQQTPQPEQPQEQAQSEEQEPEPESPPLPQKHTPVTPGPRASRFQEVFAGSLKKTLDKINKANFAACYPTVAQRAPGTLEFVQRQMVERLGQQCNKEFDSILQNRNVVAKLNELESLVSDASRRRTESGPDVNPPVPPHTLPAQTILQAHLHPHITSTQSQINAKLQTVQSHNAKLFEEIQAQRAEMERILAAVEEVLADVDGANGLLDEVVDDLAKETRAVEGEMAGLSSNGMEIRTK
ncbi:Nnf1 domain containing protein [Naviculisporaceae sp. PSN 640]